ncbi:MAG: hypothetical protein HYY07_05005, partial [Elusimicrobia bacterium]|nr:hypothetical protein [Elusimicrobiota bacterium]
SYTGVPVLGGFLREPKIQIPERHLGLKTAEENIEFHACLDSLLQLTKKDTQQPGIDLERILKIAQDTSSFPLFPSSFPRKRESRKDISGLDSRFRGNDGMGGEDGRGRNDGINVWDQLARRGILVRACNDFVGLEKDCFLRFAVKRPQENQILINALKEILGDGR